MTNEQPLSDLVAAYRAGADDMAEAVHGLSDDVIDARPTPEAWTIREIVHHMADNEIIAGVRLRCILTQDHPSLVGYDEAFYASRFDYAGRPLDGALALLKAGRQANVEVVERLAPEDWSRAGDHPESGHYSVRNLLESNIRHMASHIAQIRDNLAALAAEG